MISRDLGSRSQSLVFIFVIIFLFLFFFFLFLLYGTCGWVRAYVSTSTVPLLILAAVRLGALRFSLLLLVAGNAIECRVLAGGVIIRRWDNLNDEKMECRHEMAMYCSILWPYRCFSSSVSSSCSSSSQVSSCSRVNRSNSSSSRQLNSNNISSSNCCNSSNNSSINISNKVVVVIVVVMLL